MEQTWITRAMKMTPETLKLLKSIIRTAPNWSGTPPCYEVLTAQTRGNLTDLKKRGLVSTWKDEGIEWIDIKPAANALATTLGWLDADGDHTELLRAE